MNSNDSTEVSKFARGYWALAFFVGTALTIAVNGAHAKGITAVPGTWTAVFVAMCPPFVFAVLTEGYFLVRRSVPDRVQRVVKWSVGILALAAFAVSYETSRLFVISEEGPLPSWTGWVIPGMVDTLVAVSGYVLYVLSEHGVKHGDVHSGVPSRVSPPASERQIVTPPRITRTQPPISSSLPAVNPVKVSKPAASPAPPAPNPTDKLVDGKRVQDLEPYMDAARWMRHNRTITRKTESEVAEILKLIDAGKSSNEIRRELGGAAATYDKVAGAWRRWQSTHSSVESKEEPKLVTSMPFGSS